MEKEMTVEEAAESRRYQIIVWVRRNSTREIDIVFWLTVLVAFLLPEGPLENGVWGAAVLLTAVNLYMTYRTTKKAKAVLGRVESHDVLGAIREHMWRLPQKERSLEELEKVVAGGGVVDDGLTCFERGRHVAGCPHRPLDAS